MRDLHEVTQEYVFQSTVIARLDKIVELLEKLRDTLPTTWVVPDDLDDDTDVAW